MECPYGYVNRTSFIENYETSSVSRALGFLALGIDGGGICSAEELVNAVNNQRQNVQEQDALSTKEMNLTDELIRKNPCESVDLEIPSDKKKERTALPLEEYKEIIAGLDKLQLQDRRFLALCLYTGMRRGEVLGLRWEDISDGIIHIRRNVTHPQQNTPVITTPKTKAGIRDIPVVDPLSAILTPAEECGFIVGGESPLTLSSFRAMEIRINKTIDMHGATPHVLRHSYLTYAVGETTDYKTVQGISGHADINTLLNTYAHPQQEKVSELARNISRILT